MIDPEFAKDQLVLLLREWYMHPNGQLPAYEWAFGDVNPPVHAWAAMRVYQIERQATGVGDIEVPRARVSQIAHQLHLVGESQGRRGQERLSGRLPRPRQHRRVQPQRAAARRRAARPERRHELDGDVLPQHARDRARAGASRRGVRGRRDEIPRALLPHRARDERSRGGASATPTPICGTTTTSSTTICCGFPDGSKTYIRVRSMVGLIPLLAVETIDPELLDEAAGLPRAARVVPAQSRRSRRRRGVGHAHGRSGSAAVRDRQRAAAPRDPAPHARRERVSLAVRPALASRAGTPTIRSVCA